MTRHRLAIGMVAMVLVLAGCTSFGSVTSGEGLLEDATYAWDTDKDAYIDIQGDTYTAVYNTSGQTTIRIFRDTRYGDDRPVAIRAVQFRYPNGTVIDASDLRIVESRSDVIVEVPSDEGQLAFTAPTREKHFTTQTFVQGSYEIVLPENFRIDNFFLATVRPGGYDTELNNNRTHIIWDSMTSRSITVQYYLDRDLYLFTGLLVVVLIVGGIGLGYVWRQVRALERKRENLGLNVKSDDEFKRRPPPGMR